MRSLLFLVVLGVAGCECRGAKVVDAFDAGCGPETCDGLDEDCDGIADNDLPSLRCGVGACAREVASCVEGTARSCEPGTPVTETCNGLDDDCDGQIDEALEALACGVGECRVTVAACTGGAPQRCTPGSPTTETCDGKDNDCDGAVDEELPALACGVGACARSVASCSDGLENACSPGAPSSELCDGLDNDCNGEIDEAFPAVSCGTGDCERRVATCLTGTPQTCTPGAPASETCDGRDNDCDGAIDDGLAPTTCGVGACLRSVASCLNGAPQACVPGAPTFDLCDGLDNDCNGTIDDQGICQPPLVMCPAASQASVGSTVTLTASATDADGTIVSTQWAVIGRPPGSSAQPTPATSASTQFSPDRPGTFTLSFCARDNAGTTTCCTTAVDTGACSSPPAPPVSTACGTSWDGRPIVQFAAVPSGLQYELTLAGAPLVLATATAGANYLRPATRVTTGGPVPGSSTPLEVRACRVSDPTCCSAPSALAVDVVEACTTATTPTASNVTLSEYVVNGEGTCPSPDCVTQDTCQAGESVEITNLSNCPVSLDGYHFAYRNAAGTAASVRWMNFGPSDVIPPRGVYVAIRNRQYAPTCAAPLGAQSAGLYGLRISSLAMQGANLCSGWFNNSGGGLSELQVAPGTIPAGGPPAFTPAAAIARIAPYLSTGTACASVGFDAVDSCGSIVGGVTPTTPLPTNQLGRLWHPCDAVLSPSPACVRD